MQRNKEPRGHRKEYSTEPMWSRTDRLMSHAASHRTLFYDETKKTAFSHLPEERAEVEVMISLTGRELGVKQKHLRTMFLSI